MLPWRSRQSALCAENTKLKPKCCGMRINSSLSFEAHLNKSPLSLKSASVCCSVSVSQCAHVSDRKVLFQMHVLKAQRSIVVVLVFPSYAMDLRALLCKPTQTNGYVKMLHCINRNESTSRKNGKSAKHRKSQCRDTLRMQLKLINCRISRRMPSKNWIVDRNSCQNSKGFFVCHITWFVYGLD